MTTVVDATAERWPDLEQLMGERGDPSRCWCQYFRSPEPYRHDAREQNRAAMARQHASATVPQGVLAYLRTEGEDDLAVGWCAVGPRSEYPRLRTMRAARATDDEPGLWSITCFVVRVGYRRRGVAGELLVGALDLARRHGARAVEAYPVDTAARTSGSAALYTGTLSMYRRAGFTEVAQTGPARQTVRLVL